jgi:hypothetical protein
MPEEDDLSRKLSKIFPRYVMLLTLGAAHIGLPAGSDGRWYVNALPEDKRWN